MSEAPEQHQPVQPDAALSSSNPEPSLSQDTPSKRPASEDDIQFVSSNPVKKRRISEQKPAMLLAATQGPMPPPPPPLAQTPSPGQHEMLASHTILAHRFHSLGATGQAGGPSSLSIPSSTVENRGASLPVFRNFEFPQSLPATSSQRPRVSEAISPKQLPQALEPSHVSHTEHPPQTSLPPPQGCMSSAHPAPPATSTPASQNSVTIHDISCLDINGVPTNTPGFDASRVPVGDGNIMGGLGMNTTGAATSVANVFKPLAGQNAIPFAMYSTGSFVPMAQMHGIVQQPPAPFSNPPTPAQPQPHGMMPSHGGMSGSHDHHLARAHHHHDANQTGNPALSRPPSPGPKPPCLHCARIRQQTLLRQAQGIASPQPQRHTNAHSHTAASHYHPQQHHHHHHHLPHPPANNHHHRPPPPSSSQLVPIPRSTPPTPRPPTSAPPTITTRHPHPQPPRPITPSPHRPNPAPTTLNALDTGSNNNHNLLLQDVIQTVHDRFPYAPVAARHGVLPARVAEVLAGVVMAPSGVLRGGGRLG